jgi:hypothetical protein
MERLYISKVTLCTRLLNFPSNLEIIMIVIDIITIDFLIINEIYYSLMLRRMHGVVLPVLHMPS